MHIKVFICFDDVISLQIYQMPQSTKTLGVIQVDESVWKKLTQEEKTEIERICDEKLELYFSRLNEMIVGR